MVLWCKENNENKKDVLLVEYKPTNKIQNIKEFCEERFAQNNDISLEHYFNLTSVYKD